MPLELGKTKIKNNYLGFYLDTLVLEKLWSALNFQNYCHTPVELKIKGWRPNPLNSHYLNSSQAPEASQSWNLINSLGLLEAQKQQAWVKVWHISLRLKFLWTTFIVEYGVSVFFTEFGTFLDISFKQNNIGFKSLRYMNTW